MEYKLKNKKPTLQDQIEIIQSFVSAILENTQDSDPNFLKLVDEHFWDLA